VSLASLLLPLDTPNSNASCHLHPHIVRITLFHPRSLLNDPLLECLSYLPS
jgi:hypothetical protein